MRYKANVSQGKSHLISVIKLIRESEEREERNVGMSVCCMYAFILPIVSSLTEQMSQKRNHILDRILFKMHKPLRRNTSLLFSFITLSFQQN